MQYTVGDKRLTFHLKRIQTHRKYDRPILLLMALMALELFCVQHCANTCVFPTEKTMGNIYEHATSNLNFRYVYPGKS